MSTAIEQPTSPLFRIPAALGRDVSAILRLMWEERLTLRAVAWTDFEKRYAGSFLGILWSPLYAILFMGMYSFVYLFVFKSEPAGFTRYQYVVLLFTGFVPYLLISEVIATSAGTIKSNINIIKTTLFPAELLPVKQLIVSLLISSINWLILLAMMLPTPFLGWHLLYLPVSAALLVFMCMALVWSFAVAGVIFPDLNQFINVLTLSLLFLAPIGFRLGDSPSGFVKIVMLINPLTYLIESFRFSFLGERYTPLWVDAVVFAVCAAVAALSGAVFRRLKPVFADFE